MGGHETIKNRTDPRQYRGFKQRLLKQRGRKESTTWHNAETLSRGYKSRWAGKTARQRNTTRLAEEKQEEGRRRGRKRGGRERECPRDALVCVLEMSVHY